MQTLNLLLAAALLAGSAVDPAPTSQAVNAPSRHAPAVSEAELPESEIDLEVGSAPAEPALTEDEPVDIPPDLRQPDGTDWSDGVHVDPDLGIASDVSGSSWGLL